MPRTSWQPRSDGRGSAMGRLSPRSSPRKRAASAQLLKDDVAGKAPRFLGVLAYALLLHYAYVAFLSPTFNYLGFDARDVEIGYYALTLLAASLMSLLLPERFGRPSDFMLWACYLLVIVPTMTASHYVALLNRPEVPRFVTMIALCFLFAIVLVRRGPRFDLNVQADPRTAAGLVIAVSVGTYAYLWVTTGLQIRLTSLTEVQSLRFAYRDQAEGSLIGYLIPLQAYVVNPTIMAWGLYRRKSPLVLVGIFGQLVLYSVGGHRMAILSPIAVLGIAFAFKRSSGLRGSVLLYGLTIITGLHVLVDAFFGQNQFGLMVQRLAMFPAALAAATVEFFQPREKAYWAYSFMSPFVDYPYQQTPNFLVGGWLGNPENSANANFLADGYANFGYVGMFIETMVFVVVLWLLDATMRGLPTPVVCSMLVLPAIAFANVNAFTVILSQGIGMAMILGAFLPRTGWTGTALKPKKKGSTALGRTTSMETNG